MEEDMEWYARSKTFDAERQWIRQGQYNEVTKSLSTLTGWTLQEVEGWLAQSQFQACTGNMYRVAQRYNWTRRPVGGNEPNLRGFSFLDAFRLPMNVCD